MGIGAVPASDCSISDRAEATESEKAIRLFLHRIQSVPGVVHVEPFGGTGPGETSFRVYVRDGDIAAEYGVYEVTGEVYDQHPGGRLRVEVLEQSDLPEDASALTGSSG